MKRRILQFAAAATVVVLIVFIVSAISKAGKIQPPSAPPSLNEATLVMYGQVQPAGKAVQLAPATEGIVRKILVTEGQTVHQGQPLCQLDAAVERAQHDLANAQIEYSRRAAAISKENIRRNEPLAPSGFISDADYTQLVLKQQLDEADIAVRVQHAAVADAQVQQKEIVSPIDGIVYKMDLRPGESFTPTDIGRIVVGQAGLELVCDLEALWIGRLDTLQTYRVHNAETGEPIGTARFGSRSRYLRPRQLQTEDPKEKSSAKYQEVIMRFVPDHPDLPIGLPVGVRPDTK